MTDDLADAALAERFYGAFARRDARTMAACYAPDAHFSDPVFDLHGADVGRMWRLLCERGTDLRVERGDIVARGGEVRVPWQAWYTFGATGRRVHNRVVATLTVRDGLIRRHVDRFSFWRWSRQALGAPGWLLGATPLLQRKVRAQAARGLATFVPRD